MKSATRATLPDWVSEAVSTSPMWAHLWKPLISGGKSYGPQRMAELWIEFGQGVLKQHGAEPAPWHARRLMGAMVDGLDFGGSKSHTLKERRRPDGKAIAKAANELFKRLTAEDMAPWEPGFSTGEPLHEKITKACFYRMRSMTDRIPQAMTRTEWTPRDEAMFNSGQASAIYSLPQLLEAIAAAGNEWATTPPGGQVSDAKAARRHLLGEIANFMLVFTGARRPVIEATFTDLFFESEGLPALNPSALDRALNKAQRAHLANTEAFLQARKQWMAIEENAAWVARLRGE